MSFPPGFADAEGIIVIDESDDESSNSTSSLSDMNRSKCVSHLNNGSVVACASVDDDDASSSSSSSSLSPRWNDRNNASLAPISQGGNREADESDSFIIELDISEIRVMDQRSDHELGSDSSSSSSGIPSPWKTNSRSNIKIGEKIIEKNGIDRNFGNGLLLSVEKDSESDESIFEYNISNKTDLFADEFSQSTKRRKFFDRNCNGLNIDRSYPTKNGKSSCIHRTTASKPKSIGGDMTVEPETSKMKSTIKATASDVDTTTKPEKTAGKFKSKRRPWGKSTWRNREKPTSKTNNIESAIPPDRRSISQKTALSMKTANGSDKPNRITGTKHFHCYLLRSLHPDHPLKSYIGFCTYPPRRLRQHNGILKNGGANRTKRSGRPWTFVTIIHGFTDKITALQFEWAWQNVHKSKSFREAVGCDKLAKKMRRRLGVKARLEELRILLRECLPFCLYSLVVYFPEEKYRDIFCRLVLEATKRKRIEEHEEERDRIRIQAEGEGATLPVESETDFLENCVKVCPVDEMPFAKEEMEIKEKKKAARMNQRLAKNKTNKIAESIICYANESIGGNSICDSEMGEKTSIDDSSCATVTGHSNEDYQISIGHGNCSGLSFSPTSNRQIIEQLKDVSFNKIDESDHSALDLFRCDDGRNDKDFFVGTALDIALTEENSSEANNENDIGEIVDFQSLSLDHFHESDDLSFDHHTKYCDSSIARSDSSGSSSYLARATEKENRYRSNNRNRLRQGRASFSKQNVRNLCDSP
ncbi:hypothetical protein ACHAXS_013489 [Conticribra weissflogii]